MLEIERVAKAVQRGEILRVLKEDYNREMTSVRSLRGALDALGISLSENDLAFHLMYLADQGYLRFLRVKDLPGYRRDRSPWGEDKPDTIKFAKMLPRGLQLLDGCIAEDPSVKF